jgi:hypothetical protein
MGMLRKALKKAAKLPVKAAAKAVKKVMGIDDNKKAKTRIMPESDAWYHQAGQDREEKEE